MECAVELLNNNLIWEIELPINILMNYVIYVLFYAIFYVIFGHLKASNIVTSLILLIFGTVNMYVKEYKGSPLLPWDLTAIKTATTVAGNYSYEITYAVVFAFSLTYLVLILSHYLKEPEKKTRRLTRITLAVLQVSILYLFYGTQFFTKELGTTPDFFNQTRGYENYGALAEFVVNTKYLTLAEPDDYDPDTLTTVIAEYAEEDSPTILETALSHSDQEYDDTTASVTNPNIIVIMNESFSDLSVIGDFDTNQDYMPYLHSLESQENVISGYSYVSTIGTGTSNTEYEFLTGNSMAFLPVGSNAYQLYVKNPIPSLVSTLESQDYTSTAFHPYYRKNWNRINVYENMGFDQYIGIENITGYQYLRNYVSDEWDFSYIQNLYEKRDDSQPFFLFNVTMQNHSSYDQEDSSWTQQITLENMEGSYPLTEQYLSLIKETDDAFQDLISYFSNQEEPTIILMYGDHQPYIEDEFYEEVMGKDLSDLTDAEQQLRYITRFVLWANYDIPEGFVSEISVNYLSTMLAQVSNTTLTPYQEYLNTLYTKVPVITMMGCIDWNGIWFSVDEENEYEKELSLYHQLSYNMLVDIEHIKKELFYLEE